MNSEEYGPDRFERMLERRRLQKLRKRARKKAKADLPEEALLDEDDVLDELDRDRLEEGFRMLGASEEEDAEAEEPDEDHLFG